MMHGNSNIKYDYDYGGVQYILLRRSMQHFDVTSLQIHHSFLSWATQLSWYSIIMQ